jgi:ABC-type phosphate transport system ATPase subunit
LIGPSGCGKSTLLRIFNRMYSLYPEAARHRRGHARRQNIISNEVDLNLLRAGRHGVPEADAVPDDDLRQRRLRHPPL